MFFKTKDGKTIKRLLRYMGSFKTRILFISVCYIITTMASFIQPLIIRGITDKGMYNQDFHAIVQYSIALFVTYILWQAVEFAQVTLFADIHNEMSLELYMETFKKLLRLPISYFNEKNNAEIINQISTDIDSMSRISDYDLMISATYILRIVSGLIGLTIISWKLTILIILMIPVKYLLISRFSKIKSKSVNHLIENSRDISEWLGDNLGGIKEIKLWNLYDKKLKAFASKRSEYMKNYKKGALLDQSNSSIEYILEMGITSLLYILSGYLICTSSFTIGSAFAFLSYSTNVIGPISLVFNIRYVLAQIIPTSNRLFELLDSEEEQNSTGSWIPASMERVQDENLIVFDRVDFSYEEGRQLIKQLSLTIKRGEKVGIIGLNGSGKTTLINLLLGFYSPASGTINVDGLSISDIGLDCLRNYFAVVSQEPYLFQCTIEENIDIAQNANREILELAVKKSGAAEFICKLPLQFLHSIGKNGANLSGGERQKLAVARAFIKNAEIIILDEATSNYDVDSEKYMYNMIHNEFKDKTVILITHRYEQLSQLDRIYELENGILKIVDIGSIINT